MADAVTDREHVGVGESRERGPVVEPSGSEREEGVDVGSSGEGARPAEAAATLQQLEQTLAARTAERDAAQQALLAAHRRALLAEHAGHVVADLVQGDSVEALEASVARAREAHARIAEQLRAQAVAAVPAGNPPRSGPDFEQLSPRAKIVEALRQR